MKLLQHISPYPLFKHQHGATVIELFITLIIIGIVASLAVPAYRSLIQNYRALTLSSGFTTSLALARNEAISRGQSITVCPAATINFDSCGTNADWVNGWIVFVDPNGDGIIGNQTDRLQVNDALEPGTTFTSAQTRITYASTGFITAGAGTFNLSAPGCVGNHGRLITISNTGRANIAEAAC